MAISSIGMGSIISSRKKTSEKSIQFFCGKGSCECGIPCRNQEGKVDGLGMMKMYFPFTKLQCQQIVKNLATYITVQVYL